MPSELAGEADVVAADDRHHAALRALDAATAGVENQQRDPGRDTNTATDEAADRDAPLIGRIGVERAHVAAFRSVLVAVPHEQSLAVRERGIGIFLSGLGLEDEIGAEPHPDGADTKAGDRADEERAPAAAG